MAQKSLLVDDERLIVKGLKYSLESDGYEVDVAYDGREALDLAAGSSYDIILLDLMLPEGSGLEVCQQIREYSTVPIMMLTAKGDDMDKIMGLDYGADDYVTKPFNPLEVKARIKAILRRTQKQTPAPVHDNRMISGDLIFERDNRLLTVRGREVNLTTKEFELLDFLASHPGTVFGRAKLLELIWGQGFPGDERTVDVHVRRLREKIEENPSDPRYVRTKWGVGYYYREYVSEDK